jgi:hypothetical protein
VPQKIDDFLKTGMFSKVFDLIANVDQLAFGAVDEAEPCLSDYNVLQAFGGCSGFISHRKILLESGSTRRAVSLNGCSAG